MERKQLSILFLISRTRILRNGEVAIRVRISYDSYSAESQISRTVPVKQWSQPKGCSIGKDRAANELNAYLDSVRIKIHQIHHDLERIGEPFSAKQIRYIYAGRGVEVKTLCSIFRDHNEQCRKLIGVDYDAITVGRYDRCLEYLIECVKIQYGKDDLGLNEISPEFIRHFECYVKTVKGCAHNTATRYLKRLKKITNLAIANGWITRNPFVGIKFRETPVNKAFLTQREIDVIASKDITIERIDNVRDIFLFCTYTGLAFVDVLNLRKEHIVEDNDGELWIYKAREKTNNMCSIPLLPVPKQLIEKYKDHPTCQDKSVLLPVISNQKMNVYLKEIADICGITKNITTHTARHTFASVISLGNNVALASVSRMLGHTSTKMTERYAKVLDSSIMSEMKKVKATLDKNSNLVRVKN